MKVEYRISPRATVVAEGDTQLDVFTSLASMQEIFGESKCGKCDSEDIQFKIRTVKDGKKEYTYPEMQCRKCWAKLSYGQMEGGALFPVRYLREDGEYVKVDDKLVPKGTRGWVKYNKETGKEE